MRLKFLLHFWSYNNSLKITVNAEVKSPFNGSQAHNNWKQTVSIESIAKTWNRNKTLET